MSRRIRRHTRRDDSPTTHCRTRDHRRSARRWPGRRLWAILEPRSNSMRRKIFQEALPQSLATADKSFSAVYHATQLGDDNRLDPESVAADVRKLELRQTYCPALRPSPTILRRTEKRRLVLIMSNGSLTAYAGSSSTNCLPRSCPWSLFSVRFNLRFFHTLVWRSACTFRGSLFFRDHNYQISLAHPEQHLSREHDDSSSRFGHGANARMERPLRNPRFASRVREVKASNESGPLPSKTRQANRRVTARDNHIQYDTFWTSPALRLPTQTPNTHSSIRHDLDVHSRPPREDLHVDLTEIPMAGKWRQLSSKRMMNILSLRATTTSWQILPLKIGASR